MGTAPDHPNRPDRVRLQRGPARRVNYDIATIEFAQAQNDSSATACDQLRSRVGATLRTQARLLSIMWTAMPIRMSLVRHTA